MKKILFTFLAATLLLSACGKTTYTAFATCIDNAGANFYGAFWCPQCETQKDLFEDGVEALPYVECDRDAKDNEFITCQKKNIERYPTWIFEDGTRIEGIQSLEKLAKQTSCTLPEIE